MLSTWLSSLSVLTQNNIQEAKVNRALDTVVSIIEDNYSINYDNLNGFFKYLMTKGYNTYGCTQAHKKLINYDNAKYPDIQML